MKNLIYYFSGTGNSLMLAKLVAEKLDDCKVIHITNKINTDIDFSNVERIGFIMPVYMWGLPLIVANFLKNLNIPNNVYIFAIANYGGNCGRTLFQINDILKGKGKKLSFGLGIKMPGNYTPLYGAISKEKQQKLFKSAQQIIDNNIDIIKNKNIKKIDSSIFLVNLITSLLYKKMSPNIPYMSKKFWVNEKCNGCGICEKVCPVDNIHMVNDKPNWSLKCEQCLACLQWCPQEAIQFDKNTKKRKRYQNDNIKVSELINTNK